MSEKIHTNRQALRSRRLLQNALVDQLRKKPYRKITISDITECADLTRPTFYAHFETKDDLLLSYVDDIFVPIFDELLERMKALTPGDPSDESVIIHLFEQWRDYNEILKLIRTADIDMLILKKLREYHYETYLASIATKPSAEKLNPVLAGYIADILAGTTFMLLMHWTEKDMHHSPELMGKLLFVLTGPPTMNKVLEEFNEVIT